MKAILGTDSGDRSGARLAEAEAVRFGGATGCAEFEPCCWSVSRMQGSRPDLAQRAAASVGMVPADLAVETRRVHKSYGDVHAFGAVDLGVDFVPLSAWRCRRVVAR
jgi:hypothetical protein